MLQKRSVTALVDIAFTATSKLGKAASESEQNLRLMVGHANLVDDLMEELNEIECLTDSAVALGKQPRDDDRDAVDELVANSEDDTDDDELSEPQHFEFEGLSLTRWPSNPSPRPQRVESAESKPRPQPRETGSARRSQGYHHNLESIAEEDSSDDKMTLGSRCDECVGIQHVALRLNAPRIVHKAVPRIQSSGPQIEVQVIEITASQ